MPPRHACIDIGSNTTRLLVAEAARGGLREVAARRVFNRLGADVLGGAAIPPERLEAMAAAVADQVREARALGAEPRAVATAAIRCAANAGELCARVRDLAGVEVEVLSAGEEARLAFSGAALTLDRIVDGQLAVVDVGGGSCELAIGTVAGGAREWWSVSIGSGTLTDRCAPGDPPSAGELAEMRRLAAQALADVTVEARVELAVAVGGSATSLRRLVGERLDPRALAAGIAALGAAPAQDVARRHELALERVRLLPAGILVLAAVLERLGCPLTVGRGGLREGVVLEAMSAGGGG